MLIKCIECNHDVSEFAESCPNCGCPIERIKSIEVPVVQKIVCDDPDFEISGTVLKRYKGNSKKVIIPDGITEIAEKAFYDDSKTYMDFDVIEEYNTTMEELIIPDSVMHIGSLAFANCTALKEINIPNSVTHIGSYAFSQCMQLSSITMSENIVSVGHNILEKTAWLETQQFKTSIVLGNILYDCPYKWDSSFPMIIIPHGVKCIADGACENFRGGTIIIPDSVKSIGSESFKGCSQINEITIPNSVTHIGTSAFEDCCNLSVINLPSSNFNIEGKAFENTAWIKRQPKGLVTINNVVIGYNGDFSDDGKLFIPSGIVGIASKAFQGLYKLKEILVADSVRFIGQSAFSDCKNLKKVTLSSSLTNIEDSTFKCCNSLEEITIPNSVESIGKHAFEKCSNLKVINWGIGLKEIKDCAFSECNNLTDISFPQSLVSIGDEAFYWCNNLSNVTIPNCVVFIGKNAFMRCQNLKNAIIPSSIMSMTKDAFNINNISIKTNSNAALLPLIISDNIIRGYTTDFPDNGEIIIPQGVTTIDESAFANCKKLISISIPDSVTSIENHAFLSCENLTSISIPDSVTNLGEASFKWCSNLTDVTLSENLITIPFGTFEDCKLKDVIVIPESVESIYHKAFAYNNIKKVIIPKNVSFIEGAPFLNCDYLEEVIILNGSIEINDNQYQDEYIKDSPDSGFWTYVDSSIFGDIGYSHEITVYLPEDAEISNYFEKIYHVNVIYFRDVNFTNSGDCELTLCERIIDDEDDEYEDEIYDFDPRDFYDPDDFI